MKIEKICALKIGEKIIEQSEFEKNKIFELPDFFKYYFKKYGYHLEEVYDYSKKLIVINSNNEEYLKKYGIDSLKRVYNYETGEILDYLPPKTDEKVKYRKIIYKKIQGKDCLSVDGKEFLLKDKIRIISNTLAIYEENGMNYVYDIEVNKSYPISYTCNLENNKGNVIIQNGNVFEMIGLNNFNNLDVILENYQFVKELNGNFYPCNFEVIYGIKISDKEENIIWYETLEKQNEVYLNIQNSINALLNEKDKNLQK